jgi:hypothetical protein
MSTLALVRVPKISHAITRLLVPPPPAPPDRPHVFRGPRPYGPGDVAEFFGRSADAKACWDRLQRKPFFILEGESGCGKSSLLETILLPQASQLFHVVSCRCAEDPFGRLRGALLDEPYERNRRYGRPALAQAIESARAAYPDQPLLVCIDQLEELFVTVPDKTRAAFLEALTEFIARGRLRLLLAIRSDFSDLLLKACREADPEHTALDFDRESYYTLLPFDAEKAESVVNRMLATADGLHTDPLLLQQRKEFARELVAELLRPPGDTRLCRDDEHRVLPVELQMVGWTYESMLGGRFTAQDLKRRGGKVGLYRDYIADAKDYVFRKTGIRGEQALVVLRRLISPAGTKWPQSVEEISSACPGLSPAQVNDVMLAFAQRYIVRRLPDEEPRDPPAANAQSPSGATGSASATDLRRPEVGKSTINHAAGHAPAPRYELMHEHMIQLLREAPEPALQKLRDAEARLRFWRERTRPLFEPEARAAKTKASLPRRAIEVLRSLYTSPIPPREILSLWPYAHDRESRRMLNHSLRGYLAWPLTLLVLFVCAWTAREIRLRSPDYQLEYVIRNAPVEVVDREPSGDSNSAFEAYFTALGETGRFPIAMQEAARIVKPEHRAWAFAAVAKAAGALKRQAEAKTAISEALLAMEQVEGAHFPSPAFYAVCDAAAVTGNLRSVLDNSLGNAALEVALTVVDEPFEPVMHAELIIIANAAAHVGQADIAREALESALEGVTGQEPYFSSQVQSIAIAAAEAGQFEIAFEVAKRVNEQDRRSGAYKVLAECAARTGQIDLALDAASHMTNPNFLPETHRLIAEAAAKAGEFDTALDLASQITDPWFRAQADLAVAAHATDKQLEPQTSKAIEAATKALAQIKAESDQESQSPAYAFVALADAATRANLPKHASESIRAALDAAAQFKDPNSKNPLCVRISGAAARAGHLNPALVDSAFSAASLVTNSEYQARAYVAITEAAVNSNPDDHPRNAIDLALRSAEQIFIPVRHFDAYESIAQAATASGQTHHLIQATQRMTRPYSRAQASAAAASAAAKAKLDAQARALFEQAMAAASIENAAGGPTPAEQIRAHAAIVKSAVAANMLEIAKRAEERIPDDAEEKSPAKASIAQALAQAGRLYDARTYAESCERIDKLTVYTEILRNHPATRATQRGSP